ncbi:MAG: hypothetical protein GQ574_17045 [Crocinitomix sp.]|nr:hypothetical protein [Crocinitomix sp.]
MKKSLLLFCIIYSTGLCAQNVDTVVFNNHGKYATINGPGQGKVLTQIEIAKMNDSLYYNGQGYFKKSFHNYIIVKNSIGIIRFAGEYFHHYHDGIYIEYDQMGRKIMVGNYQYVPATTTKIKRKSVNMQAHSVKVGRWDYYEYKNAKDTVGIITKTGNYGTG